jgi:PAS domain S-box-containing protein
MTQIRPRWPRGDDEMAADIRAFDWTATPLGPIASWSERLKVMVEQVLASPLVSSLVCGPERVLIYNDAAAKLYGERHPVALSRPLPETFPEGWATVASFYERAFAGEAVKVTGQPLDTRGEGVPTDVFDALLTPVREVDGHVAYIHMTGFEVGDRVRTEAALRESERMLAADLVDAERLRSLAERLVSEESFEAIYDEVLSATVAITRADAGTIQIYDPTTKALKLIASLNFSRTVTDHFQFVDTGSRTACGLALKAGARAFVDFPDEVADLGCQLLVGEGIQSAVAQPLVSRTSAPLGMLNAHWRTLRHRPSEREMRFLDLLARQAADLIEQRRAHEALRESELRQRALVEGVPQLVWRAVDGGDWTWASPQWATHTGFSDEESRGRGWLAAYHPDDRAAAMDIWRAADDIGRLEIDARIRRASDGRYRWFQTRATALRDEQGRIVEWLGTSTDVDDLRAYQERQSIMIAELQHRTRNLIGVVRSISAQTMHNSETLKEFEAAFNQRLGALSRVQGLLSRSDDEPITLGVLLHSELAALGADEVSERILTRGPEVRLRKGTVQTFALALHELATNARKYGALANGKGRLEVTWQAYNDEGGQRLGLRWREIDLDCSGEELNPMTKAGGYGRELIERALPYVLQARTTYDLGETDLVCTIDLPLVERAEPEGD